MAGAARRSISKAPSATVRDVRKASTTTSCPSRRAFFVSRAFNVQVNYNRLLLGGVSSTQTIVTATYRLTAERTIGARIVNQGGADQGTGLGTNIYFSFGQHVRAGNDIYLLFGDPNSPKTRGKVTLKIIRPF